MLDFEVKPGIGVDRIANDLSGARLIRSRVGFKITVIRLGVANKIQAGYFKLSPTMSASEIAEALTHAYAKQVTVTIREGLRKEEINYTIEKAFKDKGYDYDQNEFSTLSKDKEGYLFPETYNFSPNATADDIINRLTSQFDSIVRELNIPASELKQTVIVASLLEREASNKNSVIDKEQKLLVSGIIHNRLKIGMGLQIDATVQYVSANSRCRQINCDWWGGSPSKSDIKIVSPYNTYLNAGLPPAPISNPGRASLEAAAHPAKTSALYYLHDDQGQIHTAETLKQHNQNICLYLKKDCR